jgi:hypothetical protein
VFCLIVLTLPPGEDTFAVKINNKINNKYKKNNEKVKILYSTLKQEFPKN